MKTPTFLMSTSKEFGIVEDGKFRTLYKKNTGMMFGITWDKDFVYMLSRNGGPGICETIEVFDKNFKHQGRIDLRGLCSGGHQLFYCQFTERLYLMNTNNKRINIFKGRKIESQVMWKNDHKCTHINSVWSPDGVDFYIMEHNGCKPPSQLVKCDSKLKPVESFSNVGKDCHCIYVEDDVLITASSKEFGIARHCLKTNTRIDFKRIEAIESDKWYTRGLGVGPDYYVLGLSAHQDIRDKRAASKQGGAVILDRDFNVMEEIVVGRRGQVLDVRIISDLDKAHNGIPF